MNPSQTEHGRQVIFVLLLTMVLNLVNALIKLVVGVVSGNLTVISDAAHGLLDACNNVIGVIALRLSWRPPDENHPYGHRKIEALASLAVGVLITLTSWEIIKANFRRWVLGEVGEYPEPTALWIVAVGVAMAVNLFVAAYEKRAGERLNSPFLLADAAHTRSEVALTCFSVSSLFLASRLPWLDGVLSMIVVAAILHTGWSVLRDNTLLLTDSPQLDPEPLRRLAEDVDGVQNCHAVRTHGMPDDVHVDMHIVVDGEMTARHTQAVELAVRNRIMDEFPTVSEISIHHQTHEPQTGEPLSRRQIDPDLFNGEGPPAGLDA